jgi:anti-sigma-K factor RskA
MTTHDDDVNAHAAEFVLGHLDAQAQADAEKRLRTDAAFASAVEAWRTRFSAFDDTAPPMTPHPDLWARIEQGTHHASSDHARATSGWRDLWNSLTAWRAATAFAGALAVTFAVVSFAALQFAQYEAARKPIYVAVLVDDATKNAGAVVNAFADGRVEMIPLTEINVPEGRALEIWTLWDRSVGPRSVGLIDRARSVVLNLNALPKTGENQLFEITLEPKTGSPIGRPTGPVLFKGTTTRAL